MNMSTIPPEISPKKDRRQLKYQHINLQLAALGQPTCDMDEDQSYLAFSNGLIKKYTQQRRLLAQYRCPADQRIENYLNDYLARNGVINTIRIPGETFVLEQKGIARELSLPYQDDEFHSAYVDSYRIQQGVLHNPQNDKRTTQGVFHIAEGGLPVPADKSAVPVAAFANLLTIALSPPDDLLKLPFTVNQADQAKLWVSLLLRPIVRPAISPKIPAQTMEVRFFAPGGLVSNLDFVESIFGNAGDPFLPENDAALDIDRWTGHTGSIILAPHLVHCRKKDLGLPHFEQATPRQRKDGMCWQNDSELYNNGKPFKLVCRDMQGVIVTIIADNYFGYSKKEIKSQISYASNLFGDCEEEHAGGALAFPRVILGEIHIPSMSETAPKPTFDHAKALLGPTIECKDSGFGIDKKHPDIIFVPAETQINIQEQQLCWQKNSEQQTLKLLIDHTYVYPNGFRVNLERHPHAPSWRLVGTYPEGTFCHKPSTVSGGGKSEISKSLSGAIISGDFFVEDFDKDMDFVGKIFEMDYSGRFRNPALHGSDQRSLLSKQRTLGSAIKLLTPSITDYSDAYNQWLKEIPQHILGLVLMIKRFYKAEWGDNWRQHFSVDLVNGKPGNELKYHGRKLIGSYLRVGFDEKGAWRVFKLRQDFMAAEKLQMEDDITASTIVPAQCLTGLNADYANPSVKLVNNCEDSFFQRPDDAINRGADLQTELDFSGKNNFISNFQPLNTKDARDLLDDVVHFEEFSKPMRHVIREAAQAQHGKFFVSSAHPRLVDGKPSQNVRYLQARPDLLNPKMRYIAELSTRLARGLRHDQPVFFPVNSVLTGRRNNPAEPTAGIRPLAIYNPIHYQELPELFMDFICSLTGKSPSTTGAGSEGALTKGPFNALSATADLNNAIVSFILCGYDGFSTAAGYIGSKRRIDHDISLLIPEIWSRLPVEQRAPKYMIENGQLEKLEDFEYNGSTVFASRLGYRITERFIHTVFGKVFNYPTAVFDEAMLKPETQDLANYADGVNNVCEAQQKVALQYFEDDSINDACPPLKALLNIMAKGHHLGKTIDEPEIRDLFKREYLLRSDWYQERLAIKQRRDLALWQRHKIYIDQCLADKDRFDPASYQLLLQKLTHVEQKLGQISGTDYLTELQGSLGGDWVHHPEAC